MVAPLVSSLRPLLPNNIPAPPSDIALGCACRALQLQAEPQPQPATQESTEPKQRAILGRVHNRADLV